MTTASIARNTSPAGAFAIGGDMPVHRLGFGAMRITGPGIWGEPQRRDECLRVLRRLPDLGIDLIDTADSYGPEVSENLIAEALHPYPSGMTIATKAGLTRQGPDKWSPVGRPEYLRQCLEMSLRRLRTDRIDLYQLHRIDPKVPADEQFDAMKQFQAEGKVRHIGLSEVSIEEIQAAQKFFPVATVQNLYNLTNRKSEEVLGFCEKAGIGFIPWFPIAAGKLAQPGGILDGIARRHGASVAQLSLAWLLHRSPAMLPIPGTSSVAHLEENAQAAGLEIGGETYEQIEAAAAQAGDE